MNNAIIPDFGVVIDIHPRINNSILTNDGSLTNKRIGVNLDTVPNGAMRRNIGVRANINVFSLINRFVNPGICLYSILA